MRRALLVVTAVGLWSSQAWTQPMSPPVGATEAAQPFDYFDGLRFDPAVPSPAQFLGYELGERFTPHHRVLAYVKTLARTSDRVRFQQYGATYEGRELALLTISSPTNLERLDGILERNRALADPRSLSPQQARRIIQTNPAIVWLSYNVHGNEASSSEAAMQVAYTMAAATNDQVRDILDKVVLFLDPMINPDGRDRYVQWANMVRGARPNPNRDAAEHNESWPGGRTNHYYFDLNRDWLWMVHPESQARIAAYTQVLPQLHVDYHEQGYRSPYFFGAGDEPYNANIPQETRQWIERYGQANARVFDAHGLVYATRERFDYLYPGYGKVLPVYHGAVGLLCEQAGGGLANLAVQVEGRYVLTLRERARHHFLTSMSYLETTAANREAQLQRFYDYFRSALTIEPGADAAYIVSADNDPGLLEKLWTLCSAHGIEIHRTRAPLEGAALRSYRTGEIEPEAAAPAGSWVIRADQPRGRLVRAIFERSTYVSSDETYDITGWSVPIVFGLSAWFTKQPVQTPLERITAFDASRGAVEGEGDYALLVDASQARFPAAVGLAARHGILCRRAGEDLVVEGRRFSRGSLIVHRVRNDAAALQAFERSLIERGINARWVSTGMTSEGPALGTNANALLAPPRILLARGEAFSAYSFGQTWHLLDREQPIPHTVVNLDRLASIDLDDYSVIVLPSASGAALNRTLGEAGVERLKRWVGQGGTLVALAGAARWASGSILGLEPVEPLGDEPPLSALSWKQREARALQDNVPGALLALELDATHPLTAGLGDWMGMLMFDPLPLPVAKDGHVVARIAQEPRISGVLSDRAKAQLAGKPAVTHHRLGRGAVVCFAADPTFRGFEHAAMRLLLNAIVYGPGL